MKPQFNKIIFWDVNFETLDYDTYCNWVIERVFNRGDEKVCHALLMQNTLTPIAYI